MSQFRRIDFVLADEIINGDYEDSIENYLPIEKMAEKVENSTVSVINEDWDKTNS